MHAITESQVATLEDLATVLEARGLRDESHLLRDVLTSVQGHPEEFSAAEAAEILGVTSQTIRNWVRGGVISGRQDQTHHFYVPKETLDGALAMQAALPERAVEITDDEIDAEIDAVRLERRTRLAGQ